MKLASDALAHNTACNVSHLRARWGSSGFSLDTALTHQTFHKPASKSLGQLVFSALSGSIGRLFRNCMVNVARNH